MKFGKEFSSQMVQEWQTAYMDYNSLKKLLKEILIIIRNNVEQQSSSPVNGPGNLNRKMTLYRAFSGLRATFKGLPSRKFNEDEVILVSDTQDEGSEEEAYQTMFLRSSDEGGESEVEYFRQLDQEFNKVVKFYNSKVQEVKGEADKLSKQMDVLIALRVKVDRPGFEDMGECHGVKNTVDLDDPAILLASVSGSSGSEVQQEGAEMEALQEVELNNVGSSSDEPVRPAGTLNDKKHTRTFKPAPVDILDRVQINVEPDRPVSTIKNVILNSTSGLQYSKCELRNAESKLRQAFIDFHHQLRLLKSYCFLNMLAFSKIMKKYDKITSRNASKSYLDMVEKSCLGNSDEVNRLMEKVEKTFIKHFANGNHRKGMKSLRPKHKKERHRTTFFVGLFTGGSIALVGGIVVSIQAGDLLHHVGRDLYMNNIFPLYSLFGYIFLHMTMYGINTYYWRRYKVNYPFIFGFRPGTELGFRQIFLLASGLSVLTLAAALSHLDMDMDMRSGTFQTLTELIPFFLLILVVSIVFCPFNVIYRSSRFFLLRGAWHCISAPLYKVTLPDFFLADQLTSQVQAIRNLQFFICYYAWGDFERRTSTKCQNSGVYKTLNICVAIIPYLSRFLQCLRRLFEEKDNHQAYNALKYFSTVVALVVRTIYTQRPSEEAAAPFWSYWRVLAFTTSGMTTAYSTYWDLVMDWGLMQRNSKNAWLRDKLLIPNKSVYFIAIVVNVLLRLVWMQSVLDFEVPFLHEKVTTAVVASLEITRRGIWNFFRIENEHFNNVGKFRAFKTVPLPFHYGI